MKVDAAPTRRQKPKGNCDVNILSLTTNVPYGYTKDPENPKCWLVDEDAAQVVKRIFSLCMEGRGPSQIATLLTSEGVLNPTAYHRKEGRNTPGQESEKPHKWQQTTIVKILERREYTGCIVNFKTYTNSIWDKKQRKNPVENQAVFYGTHPVIIDVEVSDRECLWMSVNGIINQ